MSILSSLYTVFKWIGSLMLIEKLQINPFKTVFREVCCWFWHRISAHELFSTTPTEQDNCVFVKKYIFNRKMQLIWKWVAQRAAKCSAFLVSSISAWGNSDTLKMLALCFSTASGICFASKELKKVLGWFRKSSSSAFSGENQKTYLWL